MTLILTEHVGCVKRNVVGNANAHASSEKWRRPALSTACGRLVFRCRGHHQHRA